MKWKDTISRLLLFSFVLFLPTQLGKHYFMDFSFLSGVRIDYLAATLYLTDILAILLVIFNLKEFTPLLKNKLSYIFLFLLILNIVFSLSPPIAAYKSIKYMEMILVFILFKNFFKNLNHGDGNENSSRLILVGLLIGGVTELFLSILQLIYKHAIQGPFYYLGERYFTLSSPDIAKASLNGVEILRAYGSFSHPNSMAGFYLLIYFFALTYKRFSEDIILKYMTLFVSAALILCSFSKIPIIVFFILNLWYVISNPLEIKCSFCRVSRIVVIGIVSLVFLFTKGDPFTLTKRGDLFSNALTIFYHHPLFGVGQGNYLVAQNSFPIKYSYFFLQPVHNILLLFLVEGGAFLAFFSSFQLIKYFWQYKKSMFFFYLIIPVMITGFFDHYWLTLQQNMLLLPLLFALL